MGFIPVGVYAAGGKRKLGEYTMNIGDTIYAVKYTQIERDVKYKPHEVYGSEEFETEAEARQFIESLAACNSKWRTIWCTMFTITRYI